MDFIVKLHLEGIRIGLLTFFIIGLFHRLVIKAEYSFGMKAWRIFFGIGVLCIIVSVCIANFFISTSLGIVAFASFWSILEAFKQAKRRKKM